ncbi:unnamed protein product [Acanthoscelides obtectus]|uniref:Uncharacterized protein n=1 Tax=Acanthoscelides obtectus TaxID=200917 RepID=A0A9P0MEE0_ACAOB|nr:unnamed protein product [Acanthoscelides obtectus]CAK1640998.1 hypothetical protein AOBTE_LOCUS12067 [Acanthoscelides obtectus]
MPKRSRKRSRSSSPSTVGEKFLKIVKRLEKRLDKMEEKRPRQWHHGSSSGTSNSEDGSDSHSYDRRSYSGSEADGGSDIGEKEDVTNEGNNVGELNGDILLALGGRSGIARN